MENSPATHRRPALEYLLFRIAHQHFAIDAARVCAVLPAVDLIPLETPHGWICGTSKVSGREFPVVDLRAKMNIPYAAQGRTPCVIVVGMPMRGGISFAGFVADRVSCVETVRPSGVRNGFLHTSGRPRRVLDPDQILSEDEVLSFSQRETD